MICADRQAYTLQPEAEDPAWENAGGLGPAVIRGEIWLAEVGQRPRPVVVLTRDAVLDVRANVTVAEVTTQGRGLAVEVPIGPDTGIAEPSVVDADGITPSRSDASRSG